MTDVDHASGQAPTHRVIVTAGHVDHGKSTLVRALTGMEPDRLSEERRRGLTIELGYAWTTFPAGNDGQTNQQVAFVDAPGHERFVATTLAGAAAAPTALLVVAADDGWSAQSAEHRDALALLDIPAVAVAITKTATVDAARVQAVCAQVQAEVAGTSLEDAPIVHTDAVADLGIDQLRDAIATRLASLSPPPSGATPRLWIDRSFAVSGIGTVVTGTLAGGALQVGQDVEVAATRSTHTTAAGTTNARIRGMQALEQPIAVAHPGMRVAVNLSGVSHRDLGRGDLVTMPAVQLTDAVDLWVWRTHAQIARTGAWHLHVGTAAVGCRIAPFDGDAVAGDAGAVRVRLDRPLPLSAGDRVVLRDTGPRIVAGGGVVVDPLPVGRPRGRARQQRAQLLAQTVPAITGGDDAERLAAVVALAGGARTQTVAQAVAGWPADAAWPQTVTAVGDLLVLTSDFTVWQRAVAALGAGVHDDDAVAHALDAAGAPAAITGAGRSAMVDALVANDALVRIGGGVTVSAFADAAAAAQQQRADRVVDALASAGLAPPPLQALTAQFDLSQQETAALVQSGRLLRTGDVVFSREVVARAVAVLHSLDAPFTAAQAKQAWGTSRRFAIPLLEYLDRVGVTEFDGMRRQLTGRELEHRTG